jgi:D-3-phosphoglycerate dehydrogenase
MKILISDKFPAEGLKIFEETEGFTVDYQPGLSAEQLLQAVQDVDALVVRSGTQITEAVFAAAPKLKAIGRAGVGTENIDLTAANHKGVVVMHTPFGSTTTTAEHTIAMLMALARQIPAACQSTKSGKWESERFLGIEIAGKTLGVIGAGKIGRLVVERARALKMKAVVYDPNLAGETIRLLGAEQVELDELLERADFLTLHAPLTQETKNILNAETLARLKPGSYIINCATGGLIDEEALVHALAEGRVAGAALDVFYKEPPRPDHPLLAFEQVICTPHLRTATRDAQVNITVQVARQIVDFLKNGMIVNAVNVPSISAELLQTLRPYIDLAERLGSFQAQLYAKGISEVHLEYAGGVSEFPVAPLSMAALKGLLTPIVGPTVNYINAPHLARERGIRIVETKSKDSEGYSSLIQLNIVGKNGEHSVAGAMFSETDYRIVSVDGYNVEAIPKGQILVLFNADRPGMIGFIGQVLGEANINIAMMNLSRQVINDKAVSLISVDSCIPEETLEKLRAHEHILAAHQLAL